MTKKIRIAPPEAGVVVTPLNAAKLELKKRLLENHRDAGYSATEIRTQLGLGGDATREAVQVMSDYGEIYELVVRRNRRYYGRPPMDAAEQALWEKVGLSAAMDGHPSLPKVIGVLSAAGPAGLSLNELHALSGVGRDAVSMILQAKAWKIEWCDTTRYYPTSPTGPEEESLRKDAITASVGRARGKDALMEQALEILRSEDSGLTLEQFHERMGLCFKYGRDVMYYGVQVGKLGRINAKDVGKVGQFVWPGPAGIIYEIGASEEKICRIKDRLRSQLVPIATAEVRRERMRKHGPRAYALRKAKDAAAKEWVAKALSGEVTFEKARDEAKVSPARWIDLVKSERARIERARKKARQEKAKRITYAPATLTFAVDKPGRNVARMEKDARERLLRHERGDARAAGGKNEVLAVVPEQVQIQVCPPTRAGDPWINPEDLEGQSFGAGFSRMKIGSYLEESK